MAFYFNNIPDRTIELLIMFLDLLYFVKFF